MQRTWTQVGSEYSATDEQRQYLSRCFAHLNWQAFYVGLSLPAMQGLGIEGAIRQLRLPKVSHVAHSPALAPYGLYGIRAHYTNGRAEVYLIDCGDRITVLASDFHPNENKPTCDPPKLKELPFPDCAVACSCIKMLGCGECEAVCPKKFDKYGRPFLTIEKHTTPESSKEE